MPALSGEIGFADNDSYLSYNDKKVSWQSAENGGNMRSDSVHFNVQCETEYLYRNISPSLTLFQVFYNQSLIN